MKKIFLLFAVILFAASTQAQVENTSSSGIKFSLGANIGVPTTSGLSVSYGADLLADFGGSTGVTFTGSVGYQNFSWKGGGNVYFIPLLAGVKFNMGSDKFYGHAQLGYGFAQGGGGGFAYAPSIGYYFSPNFDASLKYLAFSNNGTWGTFGVRLAYSF